MSLQNEHDDFDLMVHAERKREQSGIQVYATITVTETFRVGLDGEDLKAIEAMEDPGADRRTTVQTYVERLHAWGAEGERTHDVVLSMKLRGEV